MEFLVDRQKNFYFLEMNTRLQVEHPVTEMITGVDLVEEQIRVAQGEPLRWRQDEVSFRGHAIEVRVNAEDPAKGFLPATGVVRRFRLPAGPGVRWDGAVEEGMEVGIYYDPLLGKLIVWAEDRSKAIARMLRALEEFQIEGVPTGVEAARWVLEHPAFQSGKYDTLLLETGWEGRGKETLEAIEAVAAAVAAAWKTTQGILRVEADRQAPSRWKWVGRWMSLRRGW